MSILVDTNLLTRSIQPASRHFSAATAAILELRRRGEWLCVVPQIVYEFWAVCTRPPGENGLGMSVTDAEVEQARVLSLFVLIEDTPAILPEWRRLVVAHDVKGKNSHDARLVAAMNVHGVSAILTFNGADFRRYPGVGVLDPQAVVTPPLP
jgi:predicted nucleic acid-binding protein